MVDTLIRWGSTRNNIIANKTYNKPVAIIRASNKPLCRAILKRNEIPVPEFDSHHFPCIGRKAKHTRGRGFWICRNPEDVRRAKNMGATYFSAFYPKTKEYRIHVGRKRTILVSEKGYAEHVRNRRRIRWNHRNGLFVFRHLKRKEWFDNAEMREMIKLAKRTIRALGLDFAAVDIMAYPTNSDLPKFVVCEVNTAPALSPSATRRYAKYFTRLLTGYYEKKEENKRE